MGNVRVHFVVSVSLLVTGAILLALGLPYAISNFGQPAYRFCCAMLETPTIYTALKNDDTFQNFFLYGLVSLLIGGLFLALYQIERKEIRNKP